MKEIKPIISSITTEAKNLSQPIEKQIEQKSQIQNKAEEFKQLQFEINTRIRLGQPVTQLVKKQLEITENVYKEFQKKVEGKAELDTPKKYQTKLVYLNGIKALKNRLGESIEDINKEEQSIKNEMLEKFGFNY